MDRDSPVQIVKVEEGLNIKRIHMMLYIRFNHQFLSPDTLQEDIKLTSCAMCNSA